MTRLATLTLAALLALPATAHAAPGRVTCERQAAQAANASGHRPGSTGWNRAYANAYARCVARSRTPQLQPLPPATGNRPTVNVPTWWVL